MKIVHLIVGVLCIALIGAATVWGAWCWYRVRASPWFWHLLRAGQACVVLEVALGGVLLLMGKKESSLHLIYGLLPLAVSFVGEQLRIASAQAVLDSKGLSRRPRSASCPSPSSRWSSSRSSSASSG